MPTTALTNLQANSSKTISIAETFACRYAKKQSDLLAFWKTIHLQLSEMLVKFLVQSRPLAV